MTVRDKQRTLRLPVGVLMAILLGSVCRSAVGGSGKPAATQPATSPAQTLFAKYGAPPISEREKSEAERLLTAAVLAQDWDGIVGMLAAVNDANLPAYCRAVKGHACLATNRSNESLELFASLLDSEDLASWQKWSDALAQRHPESASAWYLKGDAHARQRQWRQAEECFSKALQLDAKCYLAWNARGVAAHALGNTLLARTYFVKATQAKEDFADGYASRGVLNIYTGMVRKDQSSGAEECFAKARQSSQDSHPVLPEIGMGCVHYGRQEYPEAKQCFEAISDACDLAPIARSNALAADVGKLLLVVAQAKKVGTFVQTKEYMLTGGQVAEIAESPQGLTVSFLNGQSWGITGVDLHIPPFITIHWGPKPPTTDGTPVSNDDKEKQGTNSNGETVEPTEATNLPPGVVASTTGPGKRGGRGGGITRPPSWRPPTRPGQDRPRPGGEPKPGGKPKRAVIADIPELRPPLITDLDVIMPAGSESDHYIMVDNIATVASIVDAVTLEMTRQTPGAGTTFAAGRVSAPTLGANRLGGVDGDVRGVRSNRGAWMVSVVYGLLYPVPRSEPRS